MKNKLRLLFIKLTGYYIYKLRDLPIGSDFEYDVLNKLNIEINTIFDVGANFGQTALNFNKNFKKAKIYSFEPFQNTFNKLIENTKQLKNVRCEKIALGDQNGTKLIELVQDSQLNSLLNVSTNQGEEILEMTLNHYCLINSIINIDLLKIDTEGYELNVLKGSEEFMKNNKIKLILCEVSLSPQNTHNSSLNSIIEYLFNYNYQMIGLYETNVNHIKDGIIYSNALFMKIK